MLDYTITVTYKTQKQTASILKDLYIKFRAYLSFNNFDNELCIKTNQKRTFQIALKFLKEHKQKYESLNQYIVMKQVLRNEYIKDK